MKPDVVAKGVAQFSTAPSNGYRSLNGTSMSSPVVTGISALLVEQWRKTFSGQNPTPEMLETSRIAPITRWISESGQNRRLSALF